MVGAAQVEEPRGGNVLLVAGSGRSGTSLLSMILAQLGMHVPQPEVAADRTNPRGFGEPQWVVDFHERLLDNAVVRTSDARPQAWFETAKQGSRERFREELTGWLSGQLEQADSLVIKDPRLLWFLSLWESASERAGAESGFAVMLRPPAEVAKSKAASYGDRGGATDDVAAWVNMMLHVERGTRGRRRSFVRYHDLLDDWTAPIAQLIDEQGLTFLHDSAYENVRAVHQLVDPGLNRSTLDIAQLDLPKRLRELAEETWHHLDQLASGSTDPALLEGMDHLRAEYLELYAEAEAISRCTTMADARVAVRDERRRRREARKAADAEGSPAAGARTRARRLLTRGAARLPGRG